MNIAILGYGKMGKEIEKIALERNHNIILKIDSNCDYDLSNVDVALEFSTPESAFFNIKKCVENKVPIVVGTTGWLNRFEEIENICSQNKGTLLYSSNFSIGVNIFFEINKKLASIIAPYSEYNVSIEEIHHTEKLDKPSGTAITLANDIMNISGKKKWSIDDNNEENIFIKCKREPNVVGTHIVKYFSEIDSVEIKHRANTRRGFALGAVIASEWIIGRTGIFNMKDVLGIK